MRSPRLFLTAAIACLGLNACVVGPNYVKPTAVISGNFKEAADFKPAAPADALDRGDWWTLFNDPILNDLESKVKVSNQTLIGDEAAYREARAVVAGDRANLFPTVSVPLTASRSGGGSNAGPTRSTYHVDIGASWEPDLWGSIRRQITAAQATAQASAADLANATLSIQGEVASDYFGLRSSDAQYTQDQLSVDGYKRALTIAQNRYNAVVGTRSDLLEAQTQVASAQSDLVGTKRQRDTFEHALAVLIGQAPADFALTTGTWIQQVPDVPAGVPSTLLQRRPDIASSERRMASANEQIGIARAAYFPTLSLTGSGGFNSSELGSLFSAPNSLWSLGLSAAETVFDAGARKARVEQARASYDQSVATYRQTVLTALQNVEDDLVAAKVLDQQYVLLQQASTAADQAEQIVLNQYQAGQVAYTNVITAQTQAYQARNALIQGELSRQTTAVALIQALGGGWKGLNA